MDRSAALEGSAIGSQGFVWLLERLHVLARLPFDAALFRGRFPPPHDHAVLIEALRAAGFEAGSCAVDAEKLASLPLPAVLFRRLPEGGVAPALLVRFEAGRLVYFDTLGDAPKSRPLESFDAMFEAVALLVSPPRAEAPAESGEGDAEPQRFGLRWFVPELLRHRAIWRDVLLASAAIMLVGLATPLFTQVIVDKVVVHHSASTLAVIAAALAVFLVFNAAMSWMRQYLVLHTGNRVDAVLASHVLRHLLRLPAGYFEYRPTGVTVARLQGVETIREFITGAAVSFVLDLPFLVLLLAVMFAYSWQLSLVALSAVVLLAVLSALVTPVLRERLNRQFMLGARNHAFLTEHVAAIETVKSLQLEPGIERRYGEYLATYLASSFTTRNLSNTYHVASSALEQAMAMCILIAGALLVMRGDGFTIGMLVAFQMLAGRMAQPMLRIAGLWQEFQQASVAVRRLADVLDAPPEPHALATSRTAVGAGDVELQGISFRYSPHHPELFGRLSHRFRPGSLVAVTGPSGCGKSTLARLLQGFYPPTGGRILLDGRDTRLLAANELRASLGVVPQETRLFSDTVYENVLRADPHAGADAVVAACRAAGIHDAIERLPEGYRTRLGENGTGLSGGQRQRIAIARALLRQPRILIFDEATSSLDAETAEHFAETVNALKGRATIVFIAHAVPRSLSVDETLVLEGAA